MYKEVRAWAARFLELAWLPLSMLSEREHSPSAHLSAVALHAIALLQVHDFAQNLKDCERQLKQLEIASAGTDSTWNHAASVLAKFC